MPTHQSFKFDRQRLGLEAWLHPLRVVPVHKRSERFLRRRHHPISNVLSEGVERSTIALTATRPTESVVTKQGQQGAQKARLVRIRPTREMLPPSPVPPCHQQHTIQPPSALDFDSDNSTSLVEKLQTLGRVTEVLVRSDTTHTGIEFKGTSPPVGPLTVFVA